MFTGVEHPKVGLAVVLLVAMPLLLAATSVLVVVLLAAFSTKKESRSYRRALVRDLTEFARVLRSGT
jgi:hypothetical protein